MKKGLKRMSALCLASVIALAGCTKETIETPELLQPMAQSEMVRSVEKGIVGEGIPTIGHVVPKEYCYFWEKNVNIDSVNVEVGDYVEPGDILAVADVTVEKEIVDNLRKQKRLENENYEIDEKLYVLRHQEMEFQSTLLWATRQDKAVKEMEKDFANLEENHRFDQLLHNYRIKQLDKEIAEAEKIIQNSTLVCRQAGYVTYCKELRTGINVGASENIVVVADYEDCYIESEELVVPVPNKKEIRTYVYIDGEYEELEEYPYTSVELAAIETRGLYPPKRYVLREHPERLSVGEDLPLLCGEKMNANILYVNEDGLHQDSEGYYVYVSNNGVKEFRRVEVGLKGYGAVEVLSGLQEGELVYYNPRGLAPASFIEIPVQRRNYGSTLGIESIEKAEQVVCQYLSDYEGKIGEVYVENGSFVKKGDPIFTIITDQGAANIKDLRNRLTDLEQQYKLTQESFDKQEKNIREAKENDEKAMILELTEISKMKNASDDIYKNKSSQDNEGVSEEESEGNEENYGMPEFTDDEFNRQVEEVKRLHSYEQSALDLKLEQLVLERQRTEKEYNFNREQCQAALSKITKNNNGQGVITMSAQADGEVFFDKLEADMIVETGTYLYRISERREDVYAVKLIGTVKPGHTASLYFPEEDKTIDGKIVGISSSEQIYVTSTEENTYLTVSEGQATPRIVYVAFEGLNGEEILDKNNVMIHDSLVEDVFVLPVEVINIEVTSSELGEGEARIYFWIRRGDSLIKQYVRVQDLGFLGKSEIFVTSGLQDGDIVIQETIENGSDAIKYHVEG